MKHTYYIIIYLLILCYTLESCDKDPIKEEPSNPTENPTKPNPPIEEPSNPTPAKVSPTAYFTFDGNLDDISGNDYYGYGAPEPSFVEGMIPGTKALSFTKTGKQAFVVGDGIIDTRSMTVCFWIKNVSEGAIFHLTSANVDYGNKMMSLTYTDGHLKYVIKRSNNHMSSYFNSTGNFIHKSIDDGSWHHIALVADYNTLSYGESTTSLYVDGKLMDTVTETINPFDEKESNNCHYGSGTKFVLGGENVPSMQISCLRMYDSIQLDDRQVQEIYEKETKGIIDKVENIKGPVNSVNIKSGLSAYFPFDGTLEDISGNDYYGYGAPDPLFTDGLTSGRQALSFTKTGKQAFVVGDGIIDTRSMTVSFWIKNVSEGDIFHLTSANVDYGNKMMSLTYTDGHLKYVIKRSNNHMSSYFSSTGNFMHKTIDDGHWHHIALVADYNTLIYGEATTSLYVDGRIMDTVTETINPFDEKESNNCHYGSGTKFVLGGENVPTMQIACLRMYNAIQLDDRQVQAVYEKEVNGVIEKGDNIKEPSNSVNIKSGLSAYFPFDGTLEDISGNDYYGYGAPGPLFTEGLTSGRQALSFTKTGKQAFVVGDGIIDTRSMTVSFWIKNVSEGDIFHLTSANVDYGNKMMSLTYTEGHLKYVIKRSNNHMSSYFNSTGNFMHKTIDDGHWHHIALVADYNTLIYGEATTSLYVDGRIMDTVTETINPFDEKESNNCHYGSGTKFVLGGENVPTMQIACLRMYSSRQLNADEVKTLYKDKI